MYVVYGDNIWPSTHSLNISANSAVGGGSHELKSFSSPPAGQRGGARDVSWRILCDMFWICRFTGLTIHPSQVVTRLILLQGELPILESCTVASNLWSALWRAGTLGSHQELLSSPVSPVFNCTAKSVSCACEPSGSSLEAEASANQLVVKTGSHLTSWGCPTVSAFPKLCLSH